MAVNFSSSFSTLFAAVSQGMFAPSPWESGNTAVTVYTGTMPETTEIINDWGTYNQSSALCLWHATSGCVLEVLSNTIINAYSLPSPVNPFRDGAATWFILWTIQVPSINVITIPTTKFMIGDISGLFGTGTMKFQETSLLASTPTTFSELNFAFTYTG